MPTSRFMASSRGRLSWPGGAGPCALGRCGVIGPELKREGDGASPLGLWPMRQVLFRPDRLARPATRLSAFPLSPEAGWCDDPQSPAYNQAVVLPFPARHERLWREDNLYDLILVLGFNDAPPVSGRGSAIFLHIARPDLSGTEGCIACAAPDLLSLLAAAGPGDHLEICL